MLCGEAVGERLHFVGKNQRFCPCVRKQCEHGFFVHFGRQHHTDARVGGDRQIGDEKRIGVFADDRHRLSEKSLVRQQTGKGVDVLHQPAEGLALEPAVDFFENIRLVPAFFVFGF